MIITIAAIAYISCMVFLTAWAYHRIFHLRYFSLDYTLERCLERGDFEAGILELPWEDISIYSPRRKAELKGQCLASSLGSLQTVIILHGRTWTRHGALKYAKGFIDKSYNIVIYDLAGHGSSPAGILPVPSYGYDDKYDLDAVVDWTKARFPETKKLIVLGESLGAATALQYAAIAGDGEKRKIDGIIADCSFTSMADCMFYQVKILKVPGFIAKPAVFFACAVSKLLRGYSLKDLSPYSAALKSPIPVLFMHGEDDLFVPAWMSSIIAKARLEKKIGPTGLVLIPNAGHANSIMAEPDTYYREVFSFIDKL